MQLAVLVTNTDDSAFARARQDDAEKFAELVALVRPDWRTAAFWVCRDAFPENLAAFDGVMITGSPASVNDPDPWIARLGDMVGDVIARRQPLFGACFGHQMVARSLGARVVPNPGGWGHGRLDLTRVGATPWGGAAPSLSLYGSHTEQVERLPDGARLVFEGPGLPVGGFALGDTVFTVQHHPEMTQDFIADLVEEYAEEVGPQVTQAARASLARPADRAAFAQEIARFFEHAAAHRSGSG